MDGLEAAKKFNIYGVEENTSLCEFVEKITNKSL